MISATLYNFCPVLRSPTTNGYTTLYDKAVDGPDLFDLSKLQEFDSGWGHFLNQYRYPPVAALVCLASHLSKRFICPALAVHVYDGNFLWYQLWQNGIALDEYTTRVDESTKGSSEMPQTQGGNARKLCVAFHQEKVIKQLETILQKPDGDSQDFPELSRYDELLQMENYWSPAVRHEALARTLGMYPGWVVGANYLAITTGEMEDIYENYRYKELSNISSFEEVSSFLVKTGI